jgi:hypothetical protein
MMQADSIVDRLEGSAAVTSLRAEQEVVHLLQELGWIVRHGAFYRDPVTSKLREIDVVARTAWGKEARGRRLSVALEIICEIKSVRGYHLVFAPYTLARPWDLAQREWIGYHHERLAATLASAGAPPEVVPYILEYFHRACFVRGDERGRPHRLAMHPPEPTFRSSAFRETNVGTEKDLENSVLWRGIYSATSAVASARNRVVEHVLADAGGSIEYARHAALKTAVAMVQSDIDGAAGHVELFHPVVVVDARLWESSGPYLREIPSCRFYRIGPDYSETWCDVVAAPEAAAYFKKLTAYYQSEAMKRRLQ